MEDREGGGPPLVFYFRAVIRRGQEENARIAHQKKVFGGARKRSEPQSPNVARQIGVCKGGFLKGKSLDGSIRSHTEKHGER